ncbi:MAG: hypothetical protein M0C28_17770 [Candidatus Moduliflexus flocculans]|nr:hypothetical protein [Candidatus Moduliflexus flocculans]
MSSSSRACARPGAQGRRLLLRARPEADDCRQARGSDLAVPAGRAALPDHSKLLQARNEAVARKEANALYDEGVNLREAGKTQDALNVSFKRALDIYPDQVMAGTRNRANRWRRSRPRNSPSPRARRSRSTSARPISSRRSSSWPSLSV